jgi:hypothetical protein
MARKNVVYSFKQFNNQALAAGTVSSPITKVDQLDLASIAIAFTGTALSATVTVQVRNGDNDVFRTLDFGLPITLTGSSGAHEIDLLVMPFTDIQLVIVTASGTGTVNAVLTAKTIGG